MTSPTPRTPGSRRRSSRPQRKAWFRLSLGFACLFALLLVAGGLLVSQVNSVRNDLLTSFELSKELRHQLSQGGLAKSQETLAELGSHASSARSTATGPLWKAASYVPFVGANLHAITEVTVSADDVIKRGLIPLSSEYQTFNWETLTPNDGRVSLDGLIEAEPAVTAASTTIRLSYERMNSLDTSALHPSVAEPIQQATAQLEEVAVAVGAAASVAQTLPGVLGASEPRSYLVLIQNNAEARSTGGIPGALAILSADEGAVSLGEQSSATDLGIFRPPMPVTAEEASLYTMRIGTQMQNVNLTPHFPSAAASAKNMWEFRHPDQPVDGVLSIDPIVLASLLSATGSVTLNDPELLNLVRGTALPTALSKDNVAETLLSTVYAELTDPAIQDAYFAAVASEVFGAFTSGEAGGPGLIQALVSAAQDNRVHFWSKHSREQSIVGNTVLSGDVLREGGAAFGVFFNDGTGAKMDYYVSRTVQVIQACSKNEFGQFTVRMTATNNAPADAATSLPAYVTGGGVFGVEPGRIRTNYVVYGPSQAFVERATVNGQPVPVSSGKHGQRPVGMVPLELAPGETSTIDLVFSGVVQNSEPRLRVTPSIQSDADVIVPFERETCG